MLKNLGLVFVFVGVFLSVCSCTVITARNVTVVQSDLTETFLFEAISAGIDTDQQEAGIDVLAFLAQKNFMFYEHFAEIAKWKGGNITDAAAANFAFLLGFYGLVEYLEVNGVPGLQVLGWNAKDGESDIILSAYYNATAGNLIWDITLDSQLTQFPDGGIARVYTLTFATFDGVFNYTVTYAGRQLNVGNVVIDADSFKIGFNINYYKYSGASDNANSRIALVALVASSKAAARQVSNVGSSSSSISNIKINSGGYSGFINFENSADTWDVNGVKRSTEITFGYVNQYGAGVGFADWTADAFFLSYNQTRPQTISYDPEVGASIPQNNSSIGTQDSPSLVFTLFVLLGLIVALF